MKACINVESLPKAGPYSHAVRSNGFLFLSGCIPVDGASGAVIRDDVRAATELAISNAEQVLFAAGLTLRNVVKANVYLIDMADFAAMNAAYGARFTEEHPARSRLNSSQSRRN